MPLPSQIDCRVRFQVLSGDVFVTIPDAMPVDSVHSGYLPPGTLFKSPVMRFMFLLGALFATPDLPCCFLPAVQDVYALLARVQRILRGCLYTARSSFSGSTSDSVVGVLLNTCRSPNVLESYSPNMAITSRMYFGFASIG